MLMLLGLLHIECEDPGTTITGVVEVVKNKSEGTGKRPYKHCHFKINTQDYQYVTDV